MYLPWEVAVDPIWVVQEPIEGVMGEFSSVVSERVCEKYTSV